MPRVKPIRRKKQGAAKAKGPSRTRPSLSAINTSARGVALVTGGAKRVGRAIAIELARAGFDIAIHYRNARTEAEAVAQSIKSLGRRSVIIAAELADPGSWPGVITKAVVSLGRLDVLVNNASMFDPRPRAQREPHESKFDAEQWDQLFRVNATAPAGLSHLARPHLEAWGRGRIVNICDISAERPWPGYVSYCASKAALVAITRGLALAYAPRITVNGVSPGIAVFPDEYPPRLRKKLVELVPLKREGTPEDIARAVRFVVENDYITGQVIAVDGGRMLA